MSEPRHNLIASIREKIEQDAERYANPAKVRIAAERIIEQIAQVEAIDPEEPGAAQQLDALWRVCAWCKAVIEEGPEGAPVSHGICKGCYARVVA